jgi:hypothetical protein
MKQYQLPMFDFDMPTARVHRHVIWLEQDLEAWAELVVSEYPTTRFYRSVKPGSWREIPSQVPVVSLSPKPLQILEWELWIIIPEQDWRASLTFEREKYLSNTWRLRWEDSPAVYGRVFFDGGRLAYKPSLQPQDPYPEVLHSTVVDIFYERLVPGAEEIAKTAIRLIGRMSSNKLMRRSTPEDPAGSGVKSRTHWAGYHAIEWCLASDRRRLDWAFLPPPNWERPKRRATIARSGR